MITEEEEEWISAREVRTILQISRQRVNQLRNENKLDAKHHGIWLYKLSQVQSLKPNLRKFKDRR